ncbi:MAG: hypothetical protein AABW51_01565 [Nanoarchaeota archaeon]
MVREKNKKIEVNISNTEIFPEHPWDLEGKTGFIEKIVFVGEGRVTEIGVANLGLRNSMYLEFEDFQKFLKMYGVKGSEYLIGKPVISVYNKDNLCGLIPINVERY